MKKTIKIECADNGIVLHDKYLVEVAEYAGTDHYDTDPAALAIGKSIVATLFEDEDFQEELKKFHDKTEKGVIGYEITMYIKPLTKI